MAKSKKQPEGEIVYPEVDVILCKDDTQLTCAQAEKFLQWTAEGEGESFEADYLLVDETGKKIRCPANNSNRPFDKTHAKVLQGEILRGNWRLNGESIVIGKYGQVLSGQHRLVALVLAVQEWEADPSKYPHWKEEPTIPCLVITGVEEDDKTVNTIDTGKPRSLSDVIYRSHYFDGKTNKEKEALAKICAASVSMLAYRTGLDNEAFCVGRRTHADSLSILERHLTLLKAVKHVYEESHGSGTHLREFLPLGYAAALLYLMGSSASDPTKYQSADHPSEKLLNWDKWDSASEYIVLLSQDVPEMNAIREELARLNGYELKSPLNQCHVIAKGWLEFDRVGAGTRIKEKAVQMDVQESEDGEFYINPSDYPSVGGIDKGDPKDPLIEADEVEEGTEEFVPDPLTERAMNTGKATKKKTAKKDAGKADPKPTKKAPAKKAPVKKTSGKGKEPDSKVTKKKTAKGASSNGEAGKKTAKKKTPSKTKVEAEAVAS